MLKTNIKLEKITKWKIIDCKPTPKPKITDLKKTFVGIINQEVNCPDCVRVLIK